MLISNKQTGRSEKKSKCLDLFFFEKEVEMRWSQFVSRQTAVVAVEVLLMMSCACRPRAVRHIGRDNHLGSSNNNVAGCSLPPLIFLKQLVYSLSVIKSWKMESLKELQRTPARTLFITDNVCPWNRTAAAWGDFDTVIICCWWI